MPFKKGQSGNPGGKTSRINSASGMARKHAEEAIKRLAEELKNPDGNIAIKAANSLLERGYGKPKEYIELTGEDGGAIKTIALPATDSWLAGMFPSGKDETSKTPLPN